MVGGVCKVNLQLHVNGLMCAGTYYQINWTLEYVGN